MAPLPSQGVAEDVPMPVSAATTTSPHPVGAAIRIEGIEGGDELNGQTATVVKYEPANERYILKMDASGKGKAIKAPFVILVNANPTPAHEEVDLGAHKEETYEEKKKREEDAKKREEAATKIAAAQKAKADREKVESMKNSKKLEAGGGIAFVPGQKVQIVDLSSAPELNGEQGTLVKFDKENDRWVIRVESTGKGKGIREKNLLLVDTDGKAIPKEKTEEDLKKEEAQKKKDAEADEVRKKESAKKKAEAGGEFKPENLFHKGDLVRIYGVTSTPELNGETAKIVKYDADGGRWVVKMDSTGKGKGLK